MHTNIQRGDFVETADSMRGTCVLKRPFILLATWGQYKTLKTQTQLRSCCDKLPVSSLPTCDHLWVWRCRATDVWGRMTQENCRAGSWLVVFLLRRSEERCTRCQELLPSEAAGSLKKKTKKKVIYTTKDQMLLEQWRSVLTSFVLMLSVKQV